MTRSSPSDGRRTTRVRLFVALALPDAARTAIAAWSRSTLGSDGALRIVGADSLHVTLVFLGQRERDEVEAISSVALRAVGGLAPPRLAATEVTALPRRRPRVLALELDDERGRAAAVQAAVADALGAAGLHEPDARRFRAHVTVARVKRGAQPQPLRADAPPPGDPFDAREVVLYRSELRPDGARYESLARTRLG